MKKFAPIIVVAFVLLIIFGVWFFWGGVAIAPVSELNNSGNVEDLQDGDLVTDGSVVTKPNLDDPAWKTLTEYLAGLKAHDTEAVKKLSYQQSDTCMDKAKQADCFKLMDSAYQIGSQLKQESYVNRAEDAKQLILTTNIEKDSMGTTTVGLVRGQVVFTKTLTGQYKILSFDLGKGLYRTSTSTPVEEIYKNLESAVMDSDKDGLFDEEEQCIGDFAYPGCIKTDPKKNDTDGDGWWDGVEIFFKK